jgi:hypothetical protein
MMGLIEDMRLAIRSLWRSMGFEATADTAASVVPVVLLGIALNVMALRVVDSVRPIKGKQHVARFVRGEMKVVQTAVVGALRQIEESRRTLCQG